MTLINDSELKEIIPYNTPDFEQAFKHLLTNPLLPQFVSRYYPSLSFEKFCAGVADIRTVEDFQKRIISPTINIILERSSHGLTLSGLESISRSKKYLFISNHRDIICDPSIFTNALCIAGYQTPKICLGDNLLANQLIIDLVKMNKGVIVKRNLSTRELFKWSHLLSGYISSQIFENHDSVWIAQREGRAKDGNDQTHSGVLKMVTLSGEGDLLEKLSKLHLLPVAISYEYDPCDIYKARELYITATQGSYKKAPHEDTKSMMAGILDFKGRIHIGIGKEIDSHVLESFRNLPSKKDQVNAIVDLIDQQIHQIYKNWPTNYIAYDLLQNSESMKAHYSPEEKQTFIKRMDQRIAALNLNLSEQSQVRDFFLQNYANSVKNQLKITSNTEH